MLRPAALGSGKISAAVPFPPANGANRSNEFNEYVLAEGTDGYEVLFSLAELDPVLGAPLDLVPYADTNGDFPADGVARIVIPGENHLGRYVSNLLLVEVASIPEPSTVGLLCLGFVGWMVVQSLTRAVWDRPGRMTQFGGG